MALYRVIEASLKRPPPTFLKGPTTQTDFARLIGTHLSTRIGLVHSFLCFRPTRNTLYRGFDSTDENNVSSI